MPPVMNPYLDLTAAFNRGRRRVLISSGQAVVLHRLAIVSKDGDWVLREDEEAVRHVLGELDRRGARYRFGAPRDVRGSPAGGARTSSIGATAFGCAPTSWNGRSTGP